MTKVLLVGIDGSKCGERALEYAAEWAAASGHQLIVAHVIEWSPYTFNTPEENEMRHKRREEEIERAKAQVLDPFAAFRRSQCRRPRRLRLADHDRLDRVRLVRGGHPAARRPA